MRKDAQIVERERKTGLPCLHPADKIVSAVPAGLDGSGGPARTEPADTGGGSKQRSSAKGNKDVTAVTAERKLFTDRYDMIDRNHRLSSNVGTVCPVIRSQRHALRQR